MKVYNESVASCTCHHKWEALSEQGASGHKSKRDVITTSNEAQLLHSSNLHFNVVPENFEALGPRRTSVALEIWLLSFAATHEQPLPLAHYCAIGSLVSVASATHTNEQSRGAILQNSSATQHRSLQSCLWKLLNHPAYSVSSSNAWATPCYTIMKKWKWLFVSSSERKTPVYTVKAILNSWKDVIM
jgi:hypothetical protein